MISFLKRYRDALKLNHGWEVKLKCSQCGNNEIPLCTGLRIKR